jgi:hypothetical protein
MDRNRGIITLARYLARQEVRQRWKAEGRKLHEFSGRDIAIKADEYLKEHIELIKQAKAKLDH